jgi:hypothetical protein
VDCNGTPGRKADGGVKLVWRGLATRATLGRTREYLIEGNQMEFTDENENVLVQFETNDNID